MRSGDIWRFAGQVGNVGAPALRREPSTWLGLRQAQSLKLVTEST